MKRGFTVFEVLVALVLGSGLVIIAQGAFRVATDHSLRISEQRRELDRAMNGRRLLDLLISNAALDDASGRSFAGAETALEFAARLNSTKSVSQLRTVRLAVNGGHFCATIDSDSIELGAARSVEFDYLLTYGADAPWVRSWTSIATLPVAIRLRVAASAGSAVDTMLFVIGQRG